MATRELPTGTVSQELQPQGTWAQAAGKSPLVTQGDSPSPGAQVWGLGVVPWGTWRASGRGAGSSVPPDPVCADGGACLPLIGHRSPSLRGECRCRWEHGSEQAGSVPDTHQQV